MRPDDLATDPAVLQLLECGALEPEGQVVDASNVALRCQVEHAGRSARVLYKPVRGERPLWDFPTGTLAAREVAAFVVSDAGGWGLVPPTVLREGPFGPGSVQLWIDPPSVPPPDLVDVLPPHRLPEGWLPVMRAQDEDDETVVVAHRDRPDLASVAVLDAVINNADRKASHLLVAESGRLHVVDHGVCFHTEPKLRTVLWGWVGDPLPAPDRERLTRLAGALADADAPARTQLQRLLSAAEVTALRRRVNRLLQQDCFPDPSGHWPVIPWPLW